VRVDRVHGNEQHGTHKGANGVISLSDTSIEVNQIELDGAGEGRGQLVARPNHDNQTHGQTERLPARNRTSQSPKWRDIPCVANKLKVNIEANGR